MAHHFERVLPLSPRFHNHKKDKPKVERMNNAEHLKVLVTALEKARAKADAGNKAFDAAAAAARAAGMVPDATVPPSAAAEAAWKKACVAFDKSREALLSAQAAYDVVLYKINPGLQPIEDGTRFKVVKGGGEYKLRVGQVWDIVRSAELGPVFRKLNKNGSSTRILNAYRVARQELTAGRLRIIKAKPTAKRVTRAPK